MHKNRYFEKQKRIIIKTTPDEKGKKKSNRAVFSSNSSPYYNLWSPVLLYCEQLLLNTIGVSTSDTK